MNTPLESTSSSPSSSSPSNSPSLTNPSSQQSPQSPLTSQTSPNPSSPQSPLTSQSPLCYLICDHRERAVIDQADFSKIYHTSAQLTVGDYIVMADTRVLAVIERKSLSDYAASIKDGRHENRTKMLDLRTAKGCRVIYIVEGALSAAGTTQYGGIPYSTLESSMFHLMIRDNIMIWRTKSAQDTGLMLVRFIRSMERLLAKDSLPNFGGCTNKSVGVDDTMTERKTNNNSESAIAVSSKSVIAGGIEKINSITVDDSIMIDTITSADINSILHVPAILTQTRTKPLREIVTQIWMMAPGVGVVAAATLIKYPLRRIVEQPASIRDIALGISKKAMAGLSAPTPALLANMLGGVHGVSRATAKIIIDAYGTSFLTVNLAAVVLPSGRKLGDILAARIIATFDYHC